MFKSTFKQKNPQVNSSGSENVELVKSPQSSQLENENLGFLGAAKEATCKVLDQIQDGRPIDEVISGKFAFNQIID